MIDAKFKVAWVDFKREPQLPPDPAYPDGRDLDITAPGLPSCKAALPYPAKRCGLFFVDCAVCGARVAITTAGRPDDPRSVKIRCKRLEA